MKRFLTFIMAASCLLCMVPTVSSAQDYEVPAVTVSKEKIRSGGKTYYSHVVQEKQTLFSISKAYGVSLQDIYDSNPTLNLEKDGLKKNQILLADMAFRGPECRFNRHKERGRKGRKGPPGQAESRAKS